MPQKPTYEELAQRVQELEKAESERKRAEQMLRDSEEHLSSIFRSAPIGIGSVVNRELVRVNSRLCEMTGYNEGELVGQSSRMLYPSSEDFDFVGREKYAQGNQLSPQRSHPSSSRARPVVREAKTRRCSHCSPDERTMSVAVPDPMRCQP